MNNNKQSKTTEISVWYVFFKINMSVRNIKMFSFGDSQSYGKKNHIIFFIQFYLK